ncbi:MAG: hypothetical protein MUC36_10505 [Planctomycetes bacterium]|jgi:uncharacterized protein involved in exopolysaccharide biosynthesis|nr:hypothetical protein [Planctomycetota bacterium]
MTQVEVPQLSLQRYVELVRRRRWQVVPASLLGLVVGGLIAFLIPRYFVAETLLEHNAAPADLRPGEDDPFKGIVQSAKDTIPLAVMDTMVALKWPEASITNSYELTAAQKEIAGRISVVDNNPDRNRAYAKLQVFYRDRDGERARRFTDTLVRTWLENYIKTLREPAEAEYKRSTDEVYRLGLAYDNLIHDRQELERKYEIEPDVELGWQRAKYQERVDQQKERQLQMQAMETQQLTLDYRLQQARNRLQDLPEFVKGNSEQFRDQLKSSAVAQQLYERVRQARAKMQFSFRAGSRQFLEAKRMVEQGEAQLNEMVATPAGAGEGMIANPERAKLEAEIAEDMVQRDVLLVTLQRLREQINADAARLADLIDGYAQHERKTKRLEEIDEELKYWRDRQKAADELRSLLDKKPPVRQLTPATVPPRPTDPNILVVALIGCVLGLLVAIGLILLLDMLQGTFKTVEDVERNLAVPVLGGISHLETEEERTALVRSRRRGTLLAFGFVFLVVAVVTIYYVAPTRLPPTVRDLLAMLLGK